MSKRRDRESFNESPAPDAPQIAPEAMSEETSGVAMMDAAAEAPAAIPDAPAGEVPPPAAPEPEHVPPAEPGADPFVPPDLAPDEPSAPIAPAPPADHPEVARIKEQIAALGDPLGKRNEVHQRRQALKDAKKETLERLDRAIAALEDEFNAASEVCQVDLEKKRILEHQLQRLLNRLENERKQALAHAAQIAAAASAQTAA